MTCSRRSFLQTLATLGPVLAGSSVLADFLAGCSGTAGTVAAQNGSAILSFSQFPDLQTTGGGVVVNVSGGNPIVVIRTGTSSAAALSAVCTHEGCTVEYDAGAKDILCRCHSSRFTSAGVVTAGPARSPLQSYSTSITADGITVSVG